MLCSKDYSANIDTQLILGEKNCGSLCFVSNRACVCACVLCVLLMCVLNGDRTKDCQECNQEVMLQGMSLILIMAH